MLRKLLQRVGLLILSSNLSLAKVVPLIQPGFFFDYQPTEPVRIPITSPTILPSSGSGETKSVIGQCERIHITWDRSSAIGQNPVPPYYLQVFTSTATTPFVIPAGNGQELFWDVPFAPGTQYQICMFDTNGVPGGCQAMYTVIKNSTVENPVCQNVTAPRELAIVGTISGSPSVSAGPISRFGIVDQCTDISITPKGGRPPYILTISPPLHPPYNITSNNMDPISWTVSLSWSYPFFISLLSSDGQMWANGPMHVGGFGPNDCLAPGTIPRGKAAGVAAGASIGTLVAGLVIGYGSVRILGMIRRKRSKHPETGGGPFKELRSSSDQYTIDDDQSKFPRSRSFAEIPERDTSLRSDRPEWDPNARPSRYYSLQSITSEVTASPPTTSNLPRPPIRARTFIQHYDGGHVRVEMQQSPEDVVELPPAYQRQSTGSMSTVTVTPRVPGPRSTRKRSDTH
ncbi:hypothetical protein D9756_005603 [Leucocoprinus leucothites]|uniref:Uncharacterized protein n=1 Tax=Leucocoprinus leucothites TaxID=201217 RepID=A0A8H5D7K3_9AGAR|nr:hypothetical protein D9756_005603 [Leucoagaricus leucothites]